MKLKNIVFALLALMLAVGCQDATAQNLSITYTSAGSVLVKKTVGTRVTTKVNRVPTLETLVDTQQVVGYAYTIIRFKNGSNITDTLHYAPTRDTMAGYTAVNFANYLNLKYFVNRPSGQYWRLTSSQRTALPGTSIIPNIIQVEDTDSAKIMTRDPAGIWKSAILD